MAFKLTILLAGLIFLAMYFAKGPAPERPGQVAERAPVTAEQAPPTDLTPRPEDRPADPLGQPQNALPLTEDAPAPEADPGEQAQSADSAPVRLPPLDPQGSRRETVNPQALADEIRARAAAEVAGEGPLREPPPIDPNAPSLSNLSAGVEEALTQAQQPQGSGGTNYALVTATEVNLRAGPSTAEVVVGRVSEGDQVVFLGESAEGWSSVRDPATGNTVYMASRFLEMAEE